MNEKEETKQFFGIMTTGMVEAYSDLILSNPSLKDSVKRFITNGSPDVFISDIKEIFETERASLTKIINGNFGEPRDEHEEHPGCA